MNNTCVSDCKAAEPKSRIIAIYEQLQALGSEVFELQRVVNENRTKYFGSQDVPSNKEEMKDGIVNNIEWIISDITRMVLDVRDYVKVL